MKKSFKILLASFLAVIMVFSASPLNGFADFVWFDFNVTANAVSYNGACGANMTWSLDTSTKELVISGTGDMYEDKAPWASYSSDINFVIVENGVRSIAASAFNQLDNLESVSVADSVTYIGEYAFYFCENLSKITLGNGLKEILEGTFLNCKNLRSIIIPDSVTFVGPVAFENCSKLEILTIGSGVKTIAYQTFAGCNALRDVYYPGTESEWDSIGKGSDNDYLLSAELHFGEVGYAYYGSCGYELDWILNATSGELIISGEGSSYNTTLPWVEYREMIKTVTFSDGVTKIENSSFNGCKNLETINWNQDLTHIGNSAFYDCDKLTEVSIPDSIVFIGENAFGDCDNLTGFIIGQMVKTLGSNAFENCDSLTSIRIPDRVTDGMYSLFYDCDNLESVVLGDGMTEIPSYMFYSCDKLKNVTIGENVTYIDGYAFRYCTGLQKITIPASVTTMNSDTFKSCSALTAINVAPGNAAFYSDANGILFNRDQSAILFYPVGKTATDYTIPVGVTRIESVAFTTCKLVNLTVPSTITEIGHSAFFNCENLQNVYYDGTEEDWNKVDVKTMNNEKLFETVVFLKESHTCQFGEWTVTVEPTATTDGSKEHNCTVCGKIETVAIPAMGFESAEGVAIDFAANTISGFKPGETSLDSYTTTVNDSYIWEYETDNGRLGTGAEVILKDGDDVISEYTVLVYGDTNGDSWYDGQDAVLVSCLASGMLTKDDVSQAVYTAADCNHDGVIDQLDVDLLNQAGALLANVDQSKSAEVLLETSSEYVEYISLIDQTPEIEVEDETDAPEVDAEESEAVEENSIFTFIFDLVAILKNLFNFIFGFVNV